MAQFTISCSMSILKLGPQVGVKTKVLVIGLGRIGAGYFPIIEQKEKIQAISHSSAILRNSDFELLAGVDTCKHKRETFQRFFNRPAYESIERFINNTKEKIEIVVVSTPTEEHVLTVKEAVQKLAPKIVVCEKPLGINYKETMEIIDVCKTNGILCIPGYFRKFCELSLSIKNRIKTGEFGALLDGTILYGQNLLVNGCHFLNLFLFFTSLDQKANEVMILDTSDRENPTFAIQGSQDLMIRVVGTRSDFRRTGEIQMQFERGMISYQNGGSRIVIAKNEPRRTWISESDEIYELETPSNITLLYKEIQRVLATGISASEQEVGEIEIFTQRLISIALENQFRELPRKSPII